MWNVSLIKHEKLIKQQENPAPDLSNTLCQAHLHARRQNSAQQKFSYSHSSINLLFLCLTRTGIIYPVKTHWTSLNDRREREGALFVPSFIWLKYLYNTKDCCFHQQRLNKAERLARALAETALNSSFLLVNAETWLTEMQHACRWRTKRKYMEMYRTLQICNGKGMCTLSYL